MNGPQHKAAGILVAAAGAPLVGLAPVGVLAGGALLLLWPRRPALQMVAAGLFLGLTVRYGAPPGLLLLFLLLAIVSALVPDFDHRFSTVSQVFPPGHYLFRWSISNPLTWAVAGRARMQSLVRHRELSHTVWALLVWVLAWGGGTAFAAATLAPDSAAGLVLAHLTGSLPSGWSAVPVAIRLPLFVSAAAGLGFASHILADASTKSKTRPLVPVSDWEFQLLPDRLLLTTGGRR